ncbi:MAG TPA: dihydropteroate synthase [Propionicimonas sp.]|nr:dihydropteroate synthase [Propionicimonas sp.]HQA78764.1 dihydropteroate synthase [Propionicimonas sp.]HQD97435.1 dihydropteroate synthase [Propionicimonas sp.]
MGILNVTPDSFSDGGEFLDTDAAVRHGLALAAEGADLVDVGGESTRPGALRAEPDVELARVVPVIERLVAAGVNVSIDTMRVTVAEAAVRAGAVLVNDVSGGLADGQMLEAVAELGVDYVAMHWRGPSDHMTELAHYGDVVTDVVAELHDRLAAATRAGVRRTRIILDPGLGFAKNAEHNWALLSRIDELAALGCPLLVGASRKRFLGQLLATADGPRPVREREDAGVAITALLAVHGVWGVRTHTVRAHRDAIEVAEQLRVGGSR